MGDRRMETDRGDTPLHFSARTGDLWGFCLLLDSVDDPQEALSACNASGQSVWQSIAEAAEGSTWLRLAARTAPSVVRLKRLLSASAPGG